MHINTFYFVCAHVEHFPILTSDNPHKIIRVKIQWPERTGLSFYFGFFEYFDGPFFTVHVLRLSWIG